MLIMANNYETLIYRQWYHHLYHLYIIYYISTKIRFCVQYVHECHTTFASFPLRSVLFITKAIYLTTHASISLFLLLFRKCMIVYQEIVLRISLLRLLFQMKNEFCVVYENKNVVKIFFGQFISKPIKSHYSLLYSTK